MGGPVHWGAMHRPPSAHRALGVAVATQLLGAMVLLSPVLADPGCLVPGHELGDVYKHVWSYWHTPQVITEGTWPHTRYLNAPGGGVLLDVMALPGVIMAPVTAVLGAPASANLWVLFNLFLIGFTTARLATTLGHSSVAAAAAGLVAQSSPYVLGYPLFSGVHERLGLWLFPLILLCALRLRAGASWRWAGLAAIATGAVGLGCGVYAVEAAILGGVSLPWLLWGTGAPPWRVAARRIAPLAVSCGAAAGAVLWAARTITVHPWSLSPQPGRFDGLFGVSRATYEAATLRQLLDPTQVSAQAPVDSGDLLLPLVYLGVVPLGLAIAGLRSPKARPTAAAALAGVGVFATLAMGPWLWSSPWLPNPVFVAGTWLIPGLGTMPAPFQQIAVAAPLLAIAATALLDHLPRPQLVAAGAVALTLTERQLVLPHGLVVPTAPACSTAADDAVGDGLVLNLPRQLGDRNLTPPAPFLSQIYHQQPMAASVFVGVTPWDDWTVALRGASDDWHGALQCARRAGFDWVVLDTEYVPGEADVQDLVQRISNAGAQQIDSDGRRIVLRLDRSRTPLATYRELPPFQPMAVHGQAPKVAGGPAPAPGPAGSRGSPTCPLDTERAKAGR